MGIGCASVTLSWCFRRTTLLSLTVLDRLNAGEEALVPAFWAVEVLNALLVGERRSRIRPEETRDFLDQLVGMAPTVDHAPLEEVFGPIQAVCRQYGLTPYDALYIELAQRTHWPLATLDQSQLAAAHALNIACL